MRFHTIHLPSINLIDQPINTNPLWDQIDEVVAIKEGFCWPAFLFSMVWAIFYRLWIYVFYLVAINSIVLILIFQFGANHLVIFFSLMVILILFGYVANDARRSNLRKKGFFEQIIVIAPTKNTAIRRYLDICVVRR